MNLNCLVISAHRSGSTFFTGRVFNVYKLKNNLNEDISNSDWDWNQYNNAVVNLQMAHLLIPGISGRINHLLKNSNKIFVLARKNQYARVLSKIASWFYNVPVGDRSEYILPAEPVQPLADIDIESMCVRTLIEDKMLEIWAEKLNLPITYVEDYELFHDKETYIDLPPPLGLKSRVLKIFNNVKSHIIFDYELNYGAKYKDHSMFLNGNYIEELQNTLVEKMYPHDVYFDLTNFGNSSPEETYELYSAYKWYELLVIAEKNNLFKHNNIINAGKVHVDFVADKHIDEFDKLKNAISVLENNIQDLLIQNNEITEKLKIREYEHPSYAEKMPSFFDLQYIKNKLIETNHKDKNDNLDYNLYGFSAIWKDPNIPIDRTIHPKRTLIFSSEAISSKWYANSVAQTSRSVNLYRIYEKSYINRIENILKNQGYLGFNFSKYLSDLSNIKGIKEYWGDDNIPTVITNKYSDINSSNINDIMYFAQTADLIIYLDREDKKSWICDLLAEAQPLIFLEMMKIKKDITNPNIFRKEFNGPIEITSIKQIVDQCNYIKTHNLLLDKWNYSFPGHKVYYENYSQSLDFRSESGANKFLNKVENSQLSFHQLLHNTIEDEFNKNDVCEYLNNLPITNRSIHV